MIYRLWLSIKWFAYWKWATPKNRKQMEQKFRCQFERRKPYAILQLRTRL